MTLDQKLAPIVGAVTLLICFSPSAIGRNWADRTGNYKVDAELVTVRDGKAYLEKPDGQVRKVPLESLSEKDLSFIASLPQYQSQLKPFLPSTRATESPSPNATNMPTIKGNSPIESGSIGQFRSESWGYKGLTFSNDGAYLFTLGNDNITVIDIDGSTKVAYKIGRGNRSALAMSPDGKQVITGSSDGSALTWQHDGKGNLKPGNEFSIHAGQVKFITVSPDNQHALTLHSSGVACYWEIESGDVLARFSDFHFSSGGHARFNKRGGQVMITDSKLGAVIDIRSQKIIQRMPLSKGSGQFTAISPDGNYISTGRTYDIHTFATQRTSEPKIGEGNEISWSAAFSPAGERLITGGRENVKLWNVKAGMPVQKFQMSDSGYVKYVAFSPDGIHFAAIGAPIGKLVEVFRLPSKERGR